jgi:hypothetical protein
MRWLVYLASWLLFLFGFNFAVTLMLLQTSIQISLPLAYAIALIPQFFAAARFAQWLGARKGALPESFSVWPYRIAGVALIYVVGNFVLALLKLKSGSSASGFPHPVSVLVLSVAILIWECGDWLQRVMFNWVPQRWILVLIVLVGVAVFLNFAGLLRFYAGNAVTFVLLVAYLLALGLLGTSVVRRTAV